MTYGDPGSYDPAHGYRPPDELSDPGSYPLPPYPPEQVPQPYLQYHQQPYAPPPGAYGYLAAPVVVQQAPSNGLGTAGFVTGLLGLVLFWVPYLGLVLGLLGIVLGAVGISSGRKSGAGTGLAIAGLALGIISLVPGILFLAAIASLS